MHNIDLFLKVALCDTLIAKDIYGTYLPLPSRYTQTNPDVFVMVDGESMPQLSWNLIIMQL